MKRQQTTCAFVITLVLVLMTSQVSCQSLRHTIEAAIDISMELESMLVKAVTTHAYNLETFRLQLWQRTADKNKFVLHWQRELEPLATGPVVFNLPEGEEIWINSSYLPGIMNKAVPGPLHGVPDKSKDVRLTFSNNKTLWNELKPEKKVEFDDLAMPYQLPIVFCKKLNCPDEKIDFEIITTTTVTAPPPTNPTPQPVVVVDDADDGFLQSDDFHYILIGWNILLTVFIILIGLILISICNDLDQRKKERRRYEVYERDRRLHETMASSISTDVGGAAYESPILRYETPTGMSETAGHVGEADDDVIVVPTLGQPPFGGKASRF